MGCKTSLIVMTPFNCFQHSVLTNKQMCWRVHMLLTYTAFKESQIFFIFYGTAAWCQTLDSNINHLHYLLSKAALLQFLSPSISLLALSTMPSHLVLLWSPVSLSSIQNGTLFFLIHWTFPNHCNLAWLFEQLIYLFVLPRSPNFITVSFIRPHIHLKIFQ